MAKFSKQHYISLAETLKSAGVALITTANPESVPAVTHAYNVIRARIISMLIRDNPKFRPEEFESKSSPDSVYEDYI